MTIDSMPLKSVLSLKIQKGVNSSGNPTYAYRNYSNLKTEATKEDVFSTAMALGDLMDYPMDGIQKVDYTLLSSMAD